ncbi:hypothetical protein BDP55DRAFT_671449 [Colletotrichum godetiae]|uniref:Uncharacterized protein n=1 Tax=Colletotrichum godetiae TaxID=1209918 RepID=A0AAJ0EV58_9PEZI|nr:uncharacterized protein BDP55DRAFT_671449 [Colletotrichum godetiae]KAK1672940.1 hypothetical protein BDP55DRAFT_671449 [Colletotrichum godetiae]
MTLVFFNTLFLGTLSSHRHRQTPQPFSLQSTTLTHSLSGCRPAPGATGFFLVSAIRFPGLRLAFPYLTLFSRCSAGLLAAGMPTAALVNGTRECEDKDEDEVPCRMVETHVT